MLRAYNRAAQDTGGFLNSQSLGERDDKYY